MKPLPPHPCKAPKRKFRGRKRYFRKVKQKADAFSIDPTPDEWWAFWHYHADWRGWGNCGWRYRLEHLRALAVVFLKICAAKDQFLSPFQTWILLDGEDASQDATFLHTPNANADDFPWKSDRCFWGIDDFDPFLAELFPGLPMRVGWYSYLDESDEPPRTATRCILYSPGIGVPLE